ncbi:MAG TPA: hypothetical protein VFK33_05105 [Bacillales bacterium]|nr:hypothetical protein [Bacillales bacterium]
MITAIVFVVFGLMGLAGSVILMNRIAAKKETGHQRKITVIFYIGCHGMLVIAGVLIFAERILPWPWLVLLCLITIFSRVWNGHVIFRKIHWHHHLISSFILGGGLFFF